jgi:hypothetical protein
MEDRNIQNNDFKGRLAVRGGRFAVPAMASAVPPRPGAPGVREVRWRTTVPCDGAHGTVSAAGAAGWSAGGPAPAQIRDTPPTPPPHHTQY